MEDHGHDRSGQRGEQRTPIDPDQRADADDEPDATIVMNAANAVNTHGPSDHDVDVVEPVLGAAVAIDA